MKSKKFLTISREVLHSYPLLCEHIHSALKKDVPYVSPTSQDELIDITAKDMIQDNYFKKLKKQNTILFLEICY